MTKPLRALFVLPSLGGGGAERVTIDLLRLLNRNRVMPALFLFHHSGALLREVPDGLLVPSAAGARSSGTSLNLLQSLIACARAVDVVIACLQCRTTYITWLAGTIARRPVVGWVQNAAVPGSPMFRLRHRTLMRIVQPRLTASVFPCERAYKVAARRIPFAKTRIEIIPNFISEERVRRLSEAGLSFSLKRIPGETVLIAAGRLAPQKGFDILLRALAELHRRGRRCRLIILGEGPEYPRLTRLVADLALQEFVEMPGFVANPYPIMRRSGVFVLSSRFEGLPLALLEARALGIPIVSTDCIAGPREILESGRFGKLVAVDDYAAMAAAIESLIDQPHNGARASGQQLEESPDHDAQLAVAAWEALLSDITGKSE